MNVQVVVLLVPDVTLPPILVGWVGLQEDLLHSRHALFADLCKVRVKVKKYVLEPKDAQSALLVIKRDLRLLELNTNK